MKDEKKPKESSRPPVIFEANKVRGTLLHGFAITFDKEKGMIVNVGSGTLKTVNGVKVFIPDSDR